MSENAEIFDFGPARAKWAQKLDASKAARKHRAFHDPEPRSHHTCA
jgi:hypothetical protein